MLHVRRCVCSRFLEVFDRILISGGLLLPKRKKLGLKVGGAGGGR